MDSFKSNLYSVIFLYLLIISGVFLQRIWILYIDMSYSNKRIFISSFPINIFFKFLFLILLAKNVTMMLNNNGDRKYPPHVSKLRGV